MMDIVFDCLRVAHMASFAVGIGAAAFLEMYLSKQFRDGLRSDAVDVLLVGHELVKYAVIGLWVTGLALLFFRLQVFDGAHTPKLTAKLVIVIALTVNMVNIQRFLIPGILQYRGQRLADIPAGMLASFGGIAGFSAGAWLSALLLGGIGRLKTMDITAIYGVLLPILVGATIVGAVVGLMAGQPGKTGGPVPATAGD